MYQGEISTFRRHLSGVHDYLGRLLRDSTSVTSVCLSSGRTTGISSQPSCTRRRVRLLLRGCLGVTRSITDQATLLVTGVLTARSVIGVNLIKREGRLVLLSLQLKVNAFTTDIINYKTDLLKVGLLDNFRQSPLTFCIILNALIAVTSASFVLI